MFNSYSARSFVMYFSDSNHMACLPSAGSTTQMGVQIFFELACSENHLVGDLWFSFQTDTCLVHVPQQIAVQYINQRYWLQSLIKFL